MRPLSTRAGVRKHVEQSGDNGLRALAVLGIPSHKFLDRRRQSFGRDLRHPFARAITWLVAHAHADEGAQGSRASSSDVRAWSFSNEFHHVVERGPPATVHGGAVVEACHAKIRLVVQWLAARHAEADSEPRRRAAQEPNGKASARKRRVHCLWRGSV